MVCVVSLVSTTSKSVKRSECRLRMEKLIDHCSDRQWGIGTKDHQSESSVTVRRLCLSRSARMNSAISTFARAVPWWTRMPLLRTIDGAAPTLRSVRPSAVASISNCVPATRLNCSRSGFGTTTRPSRSIVVITASWCETWHFSSRCPDRDASGSVGETVLTLRDAHLLPTADKNVSLPNSRLDFADSG